MKKQLLFALLGALVFGCGTPRDKSNDKMKQSALAYAEAIEALEKANRAPEKGRDALLAEAEKYKESAIQLGKEAVKIDPTNANAYYNTAIMMQAIARPSKKEVDIELFEEAIKFYEQGLAAMPPPPFTSDSLKNLYINFNNSLSICYRDMSDIYQKDVDKSIFYAKKSAELAERAKDYVMVTAATASFKYAGLLYKHQRWNEAVPAFEKALDIHKFAYERSSSDEVVANLRDLALFYADAVQKQAEANGAKMKSLGKDPQGNEIKVPELDAATIDKVIDFYKESLKIAPDNWDMYAALFQFASDYGRDKMALDMLKAAVDQRKDDARGNEVLGTILQSIGKNAEAAPYIKKFKELTGRK
ncbi:MAG: tetratricopeptide repeat protein [Chloroherpetonaceae bacterium]